MRFQVNRSNTQQTYFSFFRNIVPAVFLFSVVSCDNETKEKVSPSQDSVRIEDSTALVEPPKEKLMEFADTLHSRKMISHDTLKLIYSAIDQGKIKHGAYDFLPYLKNAKIIHIDTTVRNREPEKYMMEIYHEISSLVPGFISPQAGISHSYNPPPGTFGQLVMNAYPHPVMVSEDMESEDFNPKPYGHEWCMRIKYINEEDSSDYCFTSENQIVYLINQQLDAQRSEYKVIYVPLYMDEKGGIVGEKFGVIALPKMQGEGLYLLEGYGDGAYIYPWFDISTDYVEFLTEDSIRKVVSECKKLGLLDHLSSS